MCHDLEARFEVSEGGVDRVPDDVQLVADDKDDPAAASVAASTPEAAAPSSSGSPPGSGDAAAVKSQVPQLTHYQYQTTGSSET